MTTIERLRPEIRPLDEEWSATTLARILAAPVDGPAAGIEAERTRSRRRRMRIAAVGLVGAGVLGSGAAYAGGVVPGFVTDAFQRFDGEAGEEFDVSGIKPIADFTLPDGTRYTVWRGRSRDGWSCEAIREDRAGKRLDDFGYGCGTRQDVPSRSDVADSPAEDAEDYERLSFGWVQEPERDGEPQRPMYFVAYGEAPVTTATRVRVTGYGTTGPQGEPQAGNSTDVTLPVDRTTHGFGGNLTGLGRAQWHVLTYTFLDASGSEVARLTDASEDVPHDRQR